MLAVVAQQAHHLVTMGDLQWEALPRKALRHALIVD